MPTSARSSRKRVGFSPHSIDDQKAPQSFVPHRHGQPTRSKLYRERKQAPPRFRSLPARLLRSIKVNVAKTLSLFSTKQPLCRRNQASDQIPTYFIPPRDSHHSEALEDCIEFINSTHRKSL